jgi:uncharacterized membrane protein YcaP (DUF421 family)
MGIIFAMALIIVRVMGNRTVGQFSPFDFVLMVGIGDVVGNVALDLQGSVLSGVEALLGLLILQQILARSSLKSKVLRKWFEGVPIVVIQDGKVLHENLASSQFNLDDLRQELHKQGLDFTDLPDIKIARLESCGDFSIVKQPEAEPFTKRDLQNLLQGLADNPLSPEGEKAAKLDQLMADVRVLADYVKKQQDTRQGGASEPQTAKSLQ